MYGRIISYLENSFCYWHSQEDRQPFLELVVLLNWDIGAVKVGMGQSKDARQQCCQVLPQDQGNGCRVWVGVRVLHRFPCVRVVGGAGWGYAQPYASCCKPLDSLTGAACSRQVHDGNICTHIH